MRALSYEDAYQVLLLQAADEGRGPILFGDSFDRARMVPLPFLVGESFPDVYLEFPLLGDPYLDVTLLYNDLQVGTRVDSPLAGDHGAMFDWFAQASKAQSGLCCGFELDTSNPQTPEAAVHFQPREATSFVRPFFDALGEPERGMLYERQAARMPKGWSLAFCGMFRRRENAPLRVCGYMDKAQQDACASSGECLEQAFRCVGFTAYTSSMLEQVQRLLALVPEGVDFQFDVYPDGSLGDVFAIDAQFQIKQPHVVNEMFETGAPGRVMRQLEEWGIADGRWRQGVQATFARALPIELPQGGMGRYALTVMPQWVKVRWTKGVLQPSKLYLCAQGTVLD